VYGGVRHGLLTNTNILFSRLLDNDEDGTMEKGMVFTIEPMFCQGTAVGVQWPDKWTVATADGGRSAQFEHTVRLQDVCFLFFSCWLAFQVAE
jgi:methionine aminopeptidase